MKRLRENNVGTGLIIRCGQNTTLAFVHVEEGKDPQYTFYSEGTADRSLSAGDLPPQLPPDTSCIVFGSISMSMEPIASTIETLLMRECPQDTQKTPVIAFDPNIRPFMIKDRDAYMRRFEKWTAVSTIVKVSSEDLEFLFPSLEPEKALVKILGMGSRLAIVTMGPRGAIAMLRRDDGSAVEVSAPASPLSQLADTIGAGDTFHGALLSWLERRGKMSVPALTNLSETDLHNALVFANSAASIVCTRHGAEPPTLAEVENVRTP